MFFVQVGRRGPQVRVTASLCTRIYQVAGCALQSPAFAPCNFPVDASDVNFFALGYGGTPSPKCLHLRGRMHET